MVGYHTSQFIAAQTMILIKYVISKKQFNVLFWTHFDQWIYIWSICIEHIKCKRFQQTCIKNHLGIGHQNILVRNIFWFKWCLSWRALVWLYLSTPLILFKLNRLFEGKLTSFSSSAWDIPQVDYRFNSWCMWFVFERCNFRILVSLKLLNLIAYIGKRRDRRFLLYRTAYIRIQNIIGSSILIIHATNLYWKL